MKIQTSPGAKKWAEPHECKLKKLSDKKHGICTICFRITELENG